MTGTSTIASAASLQDRQIRQRDELDVLFQLSTLLAGSEGLQQVLDTAARSAGKVMRVKAASIRLVEDDGRLLVIKAVYNLSEQHLSKGPIVVEQSQLYHAALRGEMVYVEDMATDPRVLHPEDAKREGIVSILSTGMIYQGKPVGVIRLYTVRKRRFSEHEQNLLRAVAQLMAAAITNARLHAEALQSQDVQRQLKLAADVQRRMIPRAMPNLPPFDITAEYIPTFELGGDFYDFIYLDGRLGIALGDAVDHGVPASLLMASVRASLRAYAQDVPDIAEVISRVNVALTRDTLDSEFVTLFYGVLDPHMRQMTYCIAGHEPPLLLRDGQVTALEPGGMILGVDATQTYDKAVVRFRPDDMLLIYSDGLSEAMDFEQHMFGKARIMDAMKQAADLPASAALKHILWQMRCFTGLAANYDDTTTVLIRVRR